MAYRRMKPYLPDYIGKIFKELGRWWGTDPAARSQTEIDIMGEQDITAKCLSICLRRADLTVIF